jgi:hypothetical protein
MEELLADASLADAPLPVSLSPHPTPAAVKTGTASPVIARSRRRRALRKSAARSAEDWTILPLDGDLLAAGMAR